MGVDRCQRSTCLPNNSTESGDSAASNTVSLEGERNTGRGNCESEHFS